MELEFEKPLLEVEKRVEALRRQQADADGEPSRELAELERQLDKLKRQVYEKLTPWQTVQVARHEQRPVVRDFIAGICSEFVELHGDRCYRDDPAMVGGLATISEHRVVLVGTHKGKGVEDRVRCNFGMAGPDGYRKALRLMKLAEKYRLPVVCLVDTPAAYPGREAEERGQAEAIARNLAEMAVLSTPIVVAVTGEGGSGGALGVAAGDAVLMLAHAVYSVIPPEGCAAILWRDAKMAPEAAAALKITAGSLLELGIIDEVVPEPPGGAHRDPAATIAATQQAIVKHLVRLQRISDKKLVDKRIERYNRIGKFDTRKYTKH